jgi:hypothetical protein
MSLDAQSCSLKRAELEISCRKIELAQDIGSRKKKYVGPGIIAQDAQGQIVFRIFVANVENTDAARDLEDAEAFRAGKLIASEDYFTLTATDYEGVVWTADQILPSSNWYSGENLIVTGRISVLSTVGQKGIVDDIGPYFLKLHFFDAVEIPCSERRILKTDVSENNDRNVVRLEVGKYEFEICHYADELVVQVIAKEPLPPFFADRIVESLQFILAFSLSWRVFSEGNGSSLTTRYSSAYLRRSKTLMPPPILLSVDEASRFAWRMFACYLEYALRHAATYFWHPCSTHLYNAREASSNSLDAWAIGLCVTVEGISTQFPPVGLSDGEKQQVAKLRRLVARWARRTGWTLELRNRALGLLSQLGNSRVQDRVKELVVNGHIDGSHVRSWSVLRNPRVHAERYDPSKLSTEELQSTMLMIGGTTVLLYQMIFELIGYEGAYTDYSQFDYPTKYYPTVSVSVGKRIGCE